MGRIIADLILGAILLGGSTAGLYYALRKRRPPRERDVWVEPSMWYTDSRERDGFTEVCITRVSKKTQEVLERRVMATIPDTLVDYQTQLDLALDRAHEAMRVANVHLNRR